MRVFKMLSKGWIVLSLAFLHCGSVADENAVPVEPAAAIVSPAADKAQLQSLTRWDAEPEASAQQGVKPGPTQQPVRGWSCVTRCNQCRATHRNPDDCDDACNCNVPDNG